MSRPVLSYPAARKSPALVAVSKSDQARVGDLIAKARNRVVERQTEAETVLGRWLARRAELAIVAAFSDSAAKEHRHADEMVRAAQQELERVRSQREALLKAVATDSAETRTRLLSILATYYTERKRRTPAA